MVKSSSTSKKYPEPSMVNLRFKFAVIISRHQQMKFAFHHLKSQIQSGLLEAEDVFASLAVPLMKLVGMKTGELAEEGRISTVIIDKDIRVEATVFAESRYATDGSYKEDCYESKVTLAGKELIQKQKLQLMQLICLLKQIETQVNSSHNNIFQTIFYHRDSTRRFFQKIMAVLVDIHQSGTGTNHDPVVITMKFLRASLERVNLAFDSVEGGVEDLIYNLGEQICAPMMEYVKNLKAEMTAGPFLHLLASVEKMGGELRNRKLELEQERRKVRQAEEKKLEALSMLKKSEESIKKMKDYLNSILAARRNCMEYFSTPKLKGVDQDQATDEGLLWELRSKKRKCQTLDSPLGPQELNRIGFNNYSHKSRRVRPQITGRPITRNYARGLTPKTTCLDSRLLLGSSPSMMPQKVLTRKHITP